MCELRPRTSLATVVVAHSLDTGGGVVPNHRPWPGWCREQIACGQGCP